MPPIKPMLAKSVKDMPSGDVLYEPKWDGFRGISYTNVFTRTDEEVKPSDGAATAYRSGEPTELPAAGDARAAIVSIVVPDANLVGAPETPSEPPLKCYVFANGC